MKKFILKIWYQLRAETPKLWNWIAGVCAGIPLLVSAINLATSETVVPEWYSTNQFYILGGAAAIAFFAKKKTTTAGKEAVQNKIDGNK